MADENDTNDDVDDDNDTGDGDGGGNTKTFTQDDLTRVGAKERRKGKSAGQAELLESLGLDSSDDLKAIVEAHNQREEENADAVTQAEQRAKAAEDKATKAEARAAAVEHEATVLDALVDAGSDRKSARKLLKLVDAEVGADDDDIADAVAAVKEEFPVLFEESDGTDDEDGETDTKPDSTTGGSSKGKKKTKKSSQEAAKDRLRQRHPGMFKDQD